MKLKMIEGTPIQDRYLTALGRVLTSDPNLLEHHNTGVIKKAILYGTKYIVNHRYSDEKTIPKEEIEAMFQMMQIVEQLMSLLTPKEIENLFPIEKTYDGEKFGCKDYFYAKAKLNQYDQNQPIGDKIEDLLWDYQNYEVEMYMVSTLDTASKLRQCQGKPGIMEEWAAENNMPTLTVNEENGYIMDNQTHRTAPYHKAKPDYLKVVK